MEEKPLYPNVAGTNSGCDSSETDRIPINVSGRRFETLKSTLARLPHSLLGDEQRRAPFWDAARGEFFFDRSSSSFEGVLLAYQTGGKPQRPPGVPQETFLDDLRFFGLSAVEQLEVTAEARPGWKGAIGRVVTSPKVAVASAVITALSLLFFMVESVAIVFYNPTLLVMFCLELVCALALAVEAVALIIAHRWQPCSLRAGLLVIDLVSFALYFIYALGFFFGTGAQAVYIVGDVGRLLRLFRVIRLIQETVCGRALLRAAAAAAPACGVLFCLWLTTAVFFAILLYWLEKPTLYRHLDSQLEALYMVVVTMTTVGYGDMIPMTAAGRVFGCLSAYVGYTMAALPAAVLVVKFAQLTAAGDGQK